MNEKRNEIAVLFDHYSSLLSPRQRDVLDLYYNDDLSLSEIAEDLGITRQGVRNTVVTGEKLLFKLENSLGVAGRERMIRACAEKIIALSSSDEVKNEAQKLLNL